MWLKEGAVIDAQVLRKQGPPFAQFGGVGSLARRLTHRMLSTGALSLSLDYAHVHPPSSFSAHFPSSPPSVLSSLLCLPPFTELSSEPGPGREEKALLLRDTS